ncbi:MAG: hypothetical protein CND37_03825 [Bacteroidetes bacterium MED-G20]|nr:MAG: hypothetical protein CND37_03825 [Bacteroidetes bacterium MED-G20]
MIFELKNIIWFFGLIFIQIFFVDALDFGTYSSFFSPVIITFFILKQRLNTTVFQLLIAAFFLGIITDVFRNTLGLNTSILLIITFLKPTFLYAISSKEDIEKDVDLNLFNIGVFRFLLFFGISIFTYHLLFFLLEQFSFNNFLILLFRAIINTLSALIFLIFLQYIFIYKK